MAREAAALGAAAFALRAEGDQVEDLLLEAVVRELSRSLEGAPFRGLAPVGKGLALFLDATPARLLIAPGPPAPRFHPGRTRIPKLKGGRGAWPAFAGHAAGVLAGTRLEKVLKPAGDRRVALCFAGPENGKSRLVLEAFPPGRLLLLDGDGKVRSQSGRGSPRLGADGRYPWPEEEVGGAPLGLADPERIERVVREAQERGEDPLEALRLAARPVSAPLARVLLRGAPGGRGLAELIGRLIRELEAPEIPFLLVGAPEPEGIGDEVPASAPEAWPALLAVGIAGEPREECGSAGAAAARLAEIEERVEIFRGRARALTRSLERERKRCARALAAVLAETSGAKGADELRRGAEALLAAGGRARRERSVFLVPDPYDPGGAVLRVEGPPGLDALRTAETLFRKARRAERAVEVRRKRAAELEERGRTLTRLADRAGAARRLEELDPLEVAARVLGLPVGLGRPGPGKTRAAEASPARVFRSSDGLEILVGRGGRANDRLTFRVAGPEDFWLHAAGVPGAHVIVRNPGGLRELPRQTLREAASLAAHYSKASGAAVADVHLSRRRLVRRARGAAPGTVLVKRYTVHRASTRHPFPEAPGAR